MPVMVSSGMKNTNQYNDRLFLEIAINKINYSKQGGSYGN